MLAAKANQVPIGPATAKGLMTPYPRGPNWEFSRLRVVFRMGNKHQRKIAPIKASIVLSFEALYLGCSIVDYLLSRSIDTVRPKIDPKAKIVIEPPASAQPILCRICLFN